MLIKRVGRCASCVLLGTALAGVAAEPPAAPSFEQVFDLLRTNLTGETRESLDRAAVQGFLRELAPRVVVVASSVEVQLVERPPLLAARRVYRGKVAYLRIGEIREGLAEAVEKGFRELSESNALNGVVLDLRFAGGDDYPAAVAAADLFLTHEVPLINWGAGLKRSSEKAEAIELPAAVLMNRETGGAAEALAGMLRQTGVALLFGGHSAGNAGLTREFPFGDERLLRIVTAPVQLGDARRIGPEGLTPDVEVSTELERERLLLNLGPANALAGTGQQSFDAPNEMAGGRMRIDEADLVRRWRGEVVSPDTVTRRQDAPRPETLDPVLVRALDLMEGLAILRGRPVR